MQSTHTHAPMHPERSVNSMKVDYPHEIKEKDAQKAQSNKKVFIFS
jgi:hypothetical protein